MASTTTTATQPGAWQALEWPDFIVIAFSSCVATAAMLLMLHVLVNRAWVPYKIRIPGLIVCSALSGVLTSLAVTIRYGMWGSGRTLAPVLDCGAQVWLLWLSVGALFSSAFLRAYRCCRVLVWHKGSMWPAPAQLLVLMVPFFLPPAFYTEQPPSRVFFDPGTQECEPQYALPDVIALVMMILLTVTSSTLTFQLRVSRRQAPEEFRAVVATSISLAFAVILLPAIHVIMEGDRPGRRRGMLATTSLLTLCVLAAPFGRRIWGLDVVGDEPTGSGAYGLGATVGSEEVHRMVQERMKVNALASSPEASDLPAASAMAWFYRDSLDRDVLRDYFLLQASTMRILKRYVRYGAPMVLPISHPCRQNMLRSQASSSSIFERARQEIMAMFIRISPEEAITTTVARADTLSPVNDSPSHALDTTLRLSSSTPESAEGAAQRQWSSPSVSGSSARGCSASGLTYATESMMDHSTEEEEEEEEEASEVAVSAGEEEPKRAIGLGGAERRRGGRKGHAMAAAIADLNLAFGLNARNYDSDSSSDEEASRRPEYPEYWISIKNEKLGRAAAMTNSAAQGASRLYASLNNALSDDRRSSRGRVDGQHERGFWSQSNVVSNPLYRKNPLPSK